MAACWWLNERSRKSMCHQQMVSTYIAVGKKSSNSCSYAQNTHACLTPHACCVMLGSKMLNDGHQNFTECHQPVSFSSSAHRYCALITRPADENLLQNRMQSCFQTSGRRLHNGPTSSWPMTEAAKNLTCKKKLINIKIISSRSKVISYKKNKDKAVMFANFEWTLAWNAFVQNRLIV